MGWYGNNGYDYNGYGNDRYSARDSALRDVRLRTSPLGSSSSREAFTPIEYTGVGGYSTNHWEDVPAFSSGNNSYDDRQEAYNKEEASSPRRSVSSREASDNEEEVEQASSPRTRRSVPSREASDNGASVDKVAFHGLEPERLKNITESAYNNSQAFKEYLDEMVEDARRKYQTINIYGVSHIIRTKNFEGSENRIIRGEHFPNTYEINIYVNEEDVVYYSKKALTKTIIHELGHLKWQDHGTAHHNFCKTVMNELFGKNVSSREASDNEEEEVEEVSSPRRSVSSSESSDNEEEEVEEVSSPRRSVSSSESSDNEEEEVEEVSSPRRSVSSSESSDSDSESEVDESWVSNNVTFQGDDAEKIKKMTEFAYDNSQSFRNLLKETLPSMTIIGNNDLRNEKGETEYGEAPLWVPNVIYINYATHQGDDYDMVMTIIHELGHAAGHSHGQEHIKFIKKIADELQENYANINFMGYERTVKLFS